MKKLEVIPALHRATHRVGLYLQARVPGVTQGEAHLLAHLHEAGGAARVAELHRAWAHRRSTLTDILGRLEARGQVRRSVVPTDRRSILVSLTPRGRRAAAAVHRELVALERAALATAGRAAPLVFTDVADALARTAGAGVAPERASGTNRRR